MTCVYDVCAYVCMRILVYDCLFYGPLFDPFRFHYLRSMFLRFRGRFMLMSHVISIFSLFFFAGMILIVCWIIDSKR